MSDRSTHEQDADMTGTSATATPVEAPTEASAAAPVDLSAIVKAYDVRGTAGEQLTAPVARALGAAFADLLDGAGMIVAHDMRVSSPELSAAFVDGAVRRGSRVLVAGLSSTDQLYCASGLHDLAGAMFTASHNPAPDNGIKLCRPGARPISRDTGLAQIRERAETYLAAGEIPEREGGARESVETLDDYVAMMLRLVPVPDRRPLRVVVDAANAMAGHTMPAVAQHLDAVTVVPLNFRLDGTFPSHEANPLDTSTLRELQDAVRRERADLGLAFDGDADRCVVVDETGTPVPPSAITALIAVREIARARAAGEDEPVVVANLVSSRHVGEAIAGAGGRRVRSQVGHSLIKALMAREDAVFGGEHSAHYYFRDFFFADSGMFAALHVLAALQETEGPLSALVAEHDPYVASGEINSRIADAAAARERVRAVMAPRPGTVIDDLDGMTVEHWAPDAAAADPAGTDASAAGLAPASPERWWFSLRSSNTEPLLRLNVEAEDAATMERVRDEVLDIIPQEATMPDASAPDAAAAESTAAGSASAGSAARGTEAPGTAAPSASDGVGPSTGGARPGASRADVPSWVRSRLRCPVCRGELVDGTGTLECEACPRTYAVEGGIPVLIADRGEAAQD